MYKSNLPEYENVDRGYEMALERLSKAHKSFLKDYPECKDLLNEYRVSFIDINKFYNRKEYCKGFAAGAKMIIEIISGDR